MFGADGQENIPHRDWLVAVDEAVKDVQAEMAKQGRANEFLGVKVRFYCLILPLMLIFATVDHLFYHSFHYTRRA